ncbi:MAG: hypothetical protein WB791_11490 [Waddliaceae bacterium]
MSSRELNESKKMLDAERWELDQIIMTFWEAESKKERKKVELECYKLFKMIGFKTDFIDYLIENDAKDLADEMNHFLEVYHTVPHEHEKRKVA